MAKTINITEQQRAYQPVGVIRDLFYAHDKELLCDGPAGTGKTCGALNKVHLILMKYPRARGLLLRKTRKSLSETTLVTFEQKVVQEGFFDLSAHRSHRSSYQYPGSASELVVGGLDDPAKVMSSEYDIIFVDEATEITEDDWEMCISRLRNYKVPYQQILAACNPGPPWHWLNVRANAGSLRRFVTRHKDNPTYWDESEGKWTAAGEDYVVGTLGKLTGVRRHRLLEGKWAGAEGLVYEEYDPAVHLTNIEVKKEFFTRGFFASVDWGFTHPGVIQVWGLDNDGRMYLVWEVFRTEQTIEWWVEEARKVVMMFGRMTFVCDSARPDHLEAFRKRGFAAVEAFKGKEVGINAVKERLRVREDGLPRLFIFDDALRTPDPKLVEAKRPTRTAHEFDCYVWADSTVAGREEPVKEHDDGMDGLRYAVCYADKIGYDSLIVARAS